MAKATSQQCVKTLYELLTVSDRLVFTFRTGLHKRMVLQAHQRPLSKVWSEKHDIALHNIKILCHTREDGKYLFVMSRTAGQQERKEYLVKRAILDLHERYQWEVYK